MSKLANARVDKAVYRKQLNEKYTGAGIRPFGQLVAWHLPTQALAWHHRSHANAARMGARSHTCVPSLQKLFAGSSHIVTDSPPAHPIAAHVTDNLIRQISILKR